MTSMPQTGVWYWQVNSTATVQGTTTTYSTIVNSFEVCTTDCVPSSASTPSFTADFDGLLTQWSFVPSATQVTVDCPNIRSTQATEEFFPKSGTGYLHFGAGNLVDKVCNQSATSTTVNVATTARYLFVWIRALISGSDYFIITLGNATLLRIDATNYAPYHATIIYKLARFEIPDYLRGGARKTLQLRMHIEGDALTLSHVLIDQLSIISDFTQVPEGWCTMTVPVAAGLSQWCAAAGMCLFASDPCPSCNAANANQRCCMGTCMYCNTTGVCSVPALAICDEDCAANGKDACIAAELTTQNCTWCDTYQTCSSASEPLPCIDCVSLSRPNCETYSACQWCYSTGTCNSSDVVCYIVYSSEMEEPPSSDSLPDTDPVSSQQHSGGGTTPGDDNTDDYTAAAPMVMLPVVTLVVAAVAMLVK